LTNSDWLVLSVLPKSCAKALDVASAASSANMRSSWMTLTTAALAATRVTDEALIRWPNGLPLGLVRNEFDSGLAHEAAQSFLYVCRLPAWQIVLSATGILTKRFGRVHTAMKTKMRFAIPRLR
jgi:hypothetical protein